MVFNPANWLDLWSIWEFELVGGQFLAIFLSIMIIVWVCNKAQLSSDITLSILLFFGLIITGIKGSATMLIYAFTVLVIGGISYYLYSKMFKAG